jgi:twitching motility protein PilI
MQTGADGTAAEPAGGVATATADRGAPDERLGSEDAGYVLMRMGGGRYAVGMSAVAEVGRPPRLTRVPGTPPWLSGVANWRGRILAVVDVRPLLGVPVTPTGSLGRLIVLADAVVTVGFLTEGVQGVVHCDAEHLEPPPMTLEGEAATLLLGQFTQDRVGPVAVLDPFAVLNLRMRLPSPRRTG